MAGVTRQLHYGGVPVPYTVAWSGEDDLLYYGTCRVAGAPAICQRHARGEGKPRFGTPHMERQREVIAFGLCDLCARPLKNRTKVSLSHARPQPHAARAGDILQVEPLLHKECAAMSLRHCPSLRRDLAAGSLMVRQVTRWTCQMAICSAESTFEATGVRQKAVSHAKVQLVAYRDRDPAWLVPTDLLA